MADAPVPVALITGFLGSGKTTLLRELARRYAGRRILWVVNDFGALDMDGERLAADCMETVALAGGSLLCRCLAGSFRRVMGDAARRAAGGTLDGVIIEASGMARPGGMDRLLAEFGLDASLAVSKVVCVVDPVRFPVVRGALMAADEQVRACDVVLINRTDTVDSAALEHVERLVRTLTTAPMVRCAYCRADVDVLAGRNSVPLGADPAESPDSAFPKCAIEVNEPLDIAALSREIAAISASLYRCKGMVRTGNGPDAWVRIDYAGRNVEVEPCAPPKAHSGGLVLISIAGREGPAQNLVRAISQGRFFRPS